MILAFRKKFLAIKGASPGLIPWVPRQGTSIESDCLQRKVDLENDFRRLLDKSWLHQVAGLSNRELDLKYPCLGEGRQFRTWRIPVVGGRGLLGGFVALKKPTQDFTGHKRGFHDWRGILGMLKGAWKETLIPPLYIVMDTSEGGVGQDMMGGFGRNSGALIMPFGESISTKQIANESFVRLRNQTEVDKMIARTDRWLFSRGLELRDIPQIKWWDEMPFLVDLGDICRKSR